MSGRLNWSRDGAGWPHSEASRFVSAAGFSWHVQQMGQSERPAILLVHGTGASTHSWHRLMPLLAGDFTVIAPDLPGHGFTDMPDRQRLSLPGMAASLAELMGVLNVRPVVAVGHSAGAAILVRATLDGGIAPRGLISLNGALLPFGHPVGQLFAPLAKMLAMAPFVPQLMAWRARSRATVEQLLAGTGSNLAAEDIDLYMRLFQNPGHVAGALGMMANWDLAPLAHDLPRLRTPLVLIAGGADKTIAPQDAEAVRALAGGATVVPLHGLGHLAHEERPEDVAQIIRSLMQAVSPPTAHTSPAAKI